MKERKRKKVGNHGPLQGQTPSNPARPPVLMLWLETEPWTHELKTQTLAHCYYVFDTMSGVTKSIKNSLLLGYPLQVGKTTNSVNLRNCVFIKPFGLLLMADSITETKCGKQESVIIK